MNWTSAGRARVYRNSMKQSNKKKAANMFNSMLYYHIMRNLSTRNSGSSGLQQGHEMPPFWCWRRIALASSSSSSRRRLRVCEGKDIEEIRDCFLDLLSAQYS